MTTLSETISLILLHLLIIQMHLNTAVITFMANIIILEKIQNNNNYSHLFYFEMKYLELY